MKALKPKTIEDKQSQKKSKAFH